MRIPKPKEEYAIILDYLPMGDPSKGWDRPVIQAIGRDKFTLLLLTPKPGVTVKVGEEVYIGPGKRDKINSILKRLKLEDLTPIARENLTKILEDLIKKKEKEFVEFFNKVGAITPRLHALELLPGIGKKILMEILEEREKEPFKSFEDIKKRVKGISDPAKIIYERILLELQGADKYKLFTI